MTLCKKWFSEYKPVKTGEMSIVYGDRSTNEVVGIGFIYIKNYKGETFEMCNVLHCGQVKNELVQSD